MTMTTRQACGQAAVALEVRIPGFKLVAWGLEMIAICNCSGVNRKAAQSSPEGSKYTKLCRITLKQLQQQNNSNNNVHLLVLRTLVRRWGTQCKSIQGLYQDTIIVAVAIQANIINATPPPPSQMRKR